MKIKFYLLPILLLLSSNSYASSWQWGQRIGSLWTLPNSSEESIEDMVTDTKGNIYTLSHVYSANGLSVNSTTLTAPFVSNARNVLITSFNCEGKLRWTKIIGTPSGSFGKSIRADSLGGIYIFAKIYMNEFAHSKIGLDTTLVGSANMLQIIKLDTSGNYKWARTPLSDTCSYLNGMYNFIPIDMHVSNDGTVSVLAELPPGNHNEISLTLTQPETYLLRYNSAGIFQSKAKIPFSVKGTKSTMLLASQMSVAPNGNIIVIGYNFYPDSDTLFIDNQLSTVKSFVISYSSSGQFQWLQHFKNKTPLAYGMFLKRVAIDAQNNIYAAGYGHTGDTLAGHILLNSITTIGHATPILAKFNSSGNLIWAKNASVDAGSVGYGPSLSNNKVGITGSAPGKLLWSGSSLAIQHTTYVGYRPFVAIFNANDGTLLSLDSLVGNAGFNIRGEVIASDRKENFYVGGHYLSTIDIAGNTFSVTGDNDIFVAKYGTADCDFSTPNSITEAKYDSPIQLFPNPSNGFLNITFPGINSAGTVFIVNYLGAKLKQIPVSVNKSVERIDCSDLPNGNYFLLFKNSSVLYQQKFTLVNQ